MEIIIAIIALSASLIAGILSSILFAIKRKVIKNIRKTLNPEKLALLGDLYKLFYSLLPKQTHPDMDWYEACDEIALSFQTNEIKINDYLIKYSSFISEEIIKKLENAKTICSEGKFEINENLHVSEKGNKLASNFYYQIDEIINYLRKELAI